MSQLLPLASYGLQITPGEPIAPIDPEVDFPCSIRITMAAVDSANAVDDDNTPSVLRIVRPAIDLSDDEDEEDPEREDEDVPTTETVLCTLNPKSYPQQPLDIVITLHDDVLFVVSGSYPIHLSGNLVEHPYDNSDSEEGDSEEEDDYEQEGSEEEDELDGEEYDLTPDEDEIEGKITELVDDDKAMSDESSEEEIDEEELRKLIKAEEKKQKAADKAADKQSKRKAEPKEEPQANKKAKSEKKVEFSEQLEKQKGASESKFPTKKLDGGVVIEDRTAGQGRSAKRGDTIGMRYVGKLKNGKIFDKNTSGKPFTFKLGVGEVIKGWDVGVAGMKVKGERRIVIPAAMAYGKKGVPGIPGNSELTFDVKLVNIK